VLLAGWRREAPSLTIKGHIQPYNRAREGHMRLFDRRSRHIEWRRSSFCTGGECAEIGSKDGFVRIRNNQQPRTVVRLSPEEFRALQLAVRGHEFDDLG
jgi:hypothetical protein